MKPILHSPETTVFDTNGVGALYDATSCQYTGAINGQHELELKYPVTGKYFSDIVMRSIICASTGPEGKMQPFRIYKISKPHNGIVTYNARHILYDCKKIICAPFSQPTLRLALQAMKTAATTDCVFSFATDKNTSGSFTNKVPKSIWDTMGGTEGSLLSKYKGEWEFDGLTAILRDRIGSDRGVSIRYGKNLVSLSQEENIANTYTGIYPYWVGEDDTLVQLPEKVIFADGAFSHTAILDKDFSQEFTEAPTEEELRERTIKYIEENDVGVPKVSIKVKFTDLSQTDEYADLKVLEQVCIGDTVNVIFPSLNVNSTARASKVEWDCLKDKYIQIDLGSIKANLSTTIASQQRVLEEQKNEINKKTSVAIVEQIAAKLSKIFLGISGGSVRLLDTDEDGNPDELYIADNNDPDLATYVWRWNYKGWAASKNGYNGPWIMGATLEDGLLAEFITAAHITAGSISSSDGTTLYMDLSTGKLTCNNVILRGLFASYGQSENVYTKLEGGMIECKGPLGTKFIAREGYANCVTADGKVLVETNINGLRLVSRDGYMAGLYHNDENGNGIPVFIAYDTDLGTTKSYPVVWKSVNGVKTLVSNG